MAGTLILEAIVVLLALPVVSAVGGGLSTGSTVYIIGVAVLLVLMAGVQRRSWAIWANVGVQVLLIAGWVVYPGVGFIGLLFTVVWLLLVYLRATLGALVPPTASCGLSSKKRSTLNRTIRFWLDVSRWSRRPSKRNCR